MLTLKGKNIYLRALEPEDLDFVFTVENNESFWEISAHSAPYSRFLIKQYLENSHRDIYEVRQLRLVISTNDEEAIGLIDLFDFDPKHKRAGIGILINDQNMRGRGFGEEALQLLCKYCFVHLNLHQVYAGVGGGNWPSRRLFEKSGFRQTGRKKEWNFVNGDFEDELLYQLKNNVH